MSASQLDLDVLELLLRLSQLRTADGQLGLGLIILLLEHGHVCTARVADVPTSAPASVLRTTVSSTPFCALQIHHSYSRLHSNPIALAHLPKLVVQTCIFTMKQSGKSSSTDYVDCKGTRHSRGPQQSSGHTRPPLRRFPFLGGVCSPGAGVPASPALSPTLSGTGGEPAVGVGAAWEDTLLGSRGICIGAAAALAGSIQQKLDF